MASHLKSLTTAHEAFHDLVHNTYLTTFPPHPSVPSTKGCLLWPDHAKHVFATGLCSYLFAWNALPSARYMLGLFPHSLQILAQVSPYQRSYTTAYKTTTPDHEWGLEE